MTPNSLGKVVVTTAGTPVQVTATRIRACKIRIIPVATNTKPIWVGISTLNKSTGLGVLDRVEVQPTTGNGSADRFLLETHDTDRLFLDNYWIDAEVSGEGAYVAYWVE